MYTHIVGPREVAARPRSPRMGAARSCHAAPKKKRQRTADMHDPL